MADKSCRETRRQSFRRTVADAALPADYLESLKLKRRQLDDSVHKYIAAKEREFKQYEKELRHQTKATAQEPRDATALIQPYAASDPTEYHSGPSILDHPNPALHLKADDSKAKGQSNGIEGSLAPSATAPATASVTRRPSFEREKDLIGVFTPHYLPALGGQVTPVLDRTVSDPPSLPKAGRLSDASIKRVQRANSDTAAQPPPRRPPHLSIASRTSSSGSSVDGGSRLPSVLKSPTHSTRPTRKRVSLAVGDAIVAPSDSLPESMSQNTTSSHSRKRATSVDKLVTPTGDTTAASTAVTPMVQQVDMKSDTASSTTPAVTSGSHENNSSNSITFEKLPTREPAARTASQSSLSETRTSRIDPDGDLFDLEAEEADKDSRIIIDDLDDGSEVAGRIDSEPAQYRAPKPDEYYEPSEGLVPVPQGVKQEPDTVEFRPGSINAAQQPTAAGFRRPSVVSDPVYRGDDYARAEHSAVVDDIYGSSYSRPSSRGSFTAGSQGEEFMARHMRRQLAMGEYPRSPR